jgi:hypothetical protein
MKPEAQRRQFFMRGFLCLLMLLVIVPASLARADELAWQRGQSQLWGYELDFGDPSSAMRLRIQQTADRSVRRTGVGAWGLSPCPDTGRGKVRAFCWSSYGRDLRMVLPQVAFNALAALRPRTLYSYRTLDLRFPPALRLRLPLEATTSVGYEYDDDLAGIRIRIPF